MDIEALTSIVVGASKYIDRRLVKSMDKLTPQQVGSFVIEYLPDAFDEIVEFLATVIGLDPGVSREVMARKKAKGKDDPNVGTIRDPNVFPLGSEVRIIALLAEHQDVLNFFDSFTALTKSGIVKRLTKPSSEPLTGSNTDTDGQTNTLLDED